MKESEGCNPRISDNSMSELKRNSSSTTTYAQACVGRVSSSSFSVYPCISWWKSFFCQWAHEATETHWFRGYLRMYDCTGSRHMYAHALKFLLSCVAACRSLRAFGCKWAHGAPRHHSFAAQPDFHCSLPIPLNRPIMQSRYGASLLTAPV